jgi:hypothetical protein
MFTIWKYELSFKEVQYISLPQGYEILSVQNQRETICIWALVNPEHYKVTKYVKLFDTGEEITYQGEDDLMHYIGTVLFSGGGYVKHVFIER